MDANAKVNYAIVSLIDLYQRRGLDSLSAVDIAAKFQFPLGFLRSILRQLARAGIIEVTRGPAGGFKYIRPNLSDVTLMEIYEALGEQPGFKVEMAGDQQEIGWVNGFFKDYSEHVVETFKEVTLEDIAR